MMTIAQRAVLRRALSDYLALTKPRITLLVLVTTAAAFWVAARESFSLGLFMITLVGTGLAASAAGVLNCLIDRDIDALMARTRSRPLPAGRVQPLPVALFGIALTISSFVVLAWGANLLAAGLALFAILFYALVYTRWLKRTSPWCTEIGGIAGAMPPLIGWAAATGQIAAPALVLFGILLLWQPPHFWALALGRTEEYRAAGLPVLPVVVGQDATRRRSFFYALALVLVSLWLYILGVVGVFYAVGATLLGIGFIYLAWRDWRSPSPATSKTLFLSSMLYLALVFLLIVLDS
uniref:Protoheme IX farnesyltransferase n=2 Tax=Candidatus Bipolaricaulota TaxID=67810 RepID=H5SFG7_9BACT|nr:protoheme IX farnesyltransferase [uncultured Acetothermia bacterium]BAL60039.1 protoheme IX farnesyltransferase [Candidatus Acetothermum autotrophicum]